MKKLVRLIMIACVMIGLSACSTFPPSADWVSPKKFTQAEVFNAAVSAGGDLGYSASAIDRATSNLTLTKHMVKSDMTLTVQVKNIGGVIHVITHVNYPDAMFSGQFDEALKNFHVALFRTLNIDSGEMNNVVIKEAN